MDNQCVQHDSRGNLWVADFGQVATKLCPENANAGGKLFARWKCLTGEFETREPDRTDCVHDWLEDVEYLIEQSNETANNIAAIVRGKVTTSDLYGGDIFELTRLMKPLAHKHAMTMLENSENTNWRFTENMFNVSDGLLISSIAWMEINEEQRYDSSSAILATVDSVGYLLLTSLPTAGCHSGEHSFSSAHLSVQLVNMATDCDQPACFSFSTGSICVPLSVYEPMNTDWVASVATQFITDNMEMRMFPHTMINQLNNQSSIIGLSIANGTSITIPWSMSPVRITFKHEETITQEGDMNCVAWDLAKNTWYGEGCFYNEELSSLHETTCDCYHLTNFGIIMDYTGKADPFAVFLDYFSSITLIVSMIFIFTTEAFFFCHKADLSALRKRTAESQRNLWLFFGQLSFLVLVSQGEAVSLEVCEVFGAVTHLVWMLFWTWTGIEGYFLFHSVTRVFKTGTIYSLIYVFGYGVPVVSVVSFYIISKVSGVQSYVRFYGENQTPVCWLNEDFMWILLSNVGMVVAFNVAVTAKAVTAAYQSAGFRNVGQSEKILGALRNTLILTFMLGLGFVLGFFPVISAQGPQQYLFVILNSSSGVFIFISTILTNDNFTFEFKRTSSFPRSSVITASDTWSRSTSGSQTPPILNSIRHSISHSVGVESLKKDINEVCQDKGPLMLSITESSTKIIMRITVDKELESRVKHN